MNEQNEALKKQQPAKTYKRSLRNIFIHKPLQREFLFVTIALFMVSTFAIGFVIHTTVQEAVSGGGLHFGKMVPTKSLTDASYDLVLRVSLILLLTLFVLAMFGISLLHRVAGPVYRFRVVLGKVNQGGRPHAIKLREGDFFTETADEINKLLKRVEEDDLRLQSVKDQLVRILNMNPNHEIQQAARAAEEIILGTDKKP